MRFPLVQLYAFNRCKPNIVVKGIEGELQWDECDLTGLSPERTGVTVTDCGGIPKGQYDNLPKLFRATDGKEYPIEDIVMLG